MMNGGGMGGMGLMWVFGLLVLAGVIVLVVVLVKTLSGRSSNTGAPDHGRAPGADPGRLNRRKIRYLLAPVAEPAAAILVDSAKGRRPACLSQNQRG